MKSSSRYSDGIEWITIEFYSLSVPWMYYEFIIYFANALWNHYLFDEFTMNSLSIREYIFITWFFPRIHYEFIIFSRIFYESTICSMNSQWISYLFRDFPMNPLSVSRIYYHFRENTMNSLSVSRIPYESLYVLRIRYEFSIFLRIHCTFTINSRRYRPLSELWFKLIWLSNFQSLLSDVNLLRI